MKANKPANLILSTNKFPVVGIGASAGGLDAFKLLLRAIPEDSGIAYVLVQHLDPTHESMLPEILRKVTRVPVYEISDDIEVKPDHIYILPSNKMLVANDGVLQLTPRVTKKNERNLPIDLFFNSLAEVHESHAIGVVLSGTSNDGTEGLKAIKEKGGLTFAQDEVSSAYEGMPSSAVAAGVVDYILSPEKIPGKVIELTSHFFKEDEFATGNRELNGDLLPAILSLLRILKGTDFTYYKQTTIRRRIHRRMVFHKIENYADYYKYLKENEIEQEVLYQDLLIPVTSFFRDPTTFEHLCRDVLPKLIIEKKTIEPLRLWVAGCSSGQEAYSIAICLSEFLENNEPQMPGRNIQIFASDINEANIVKARKGIYSKTELEGLSLQRLNEFFVKCTGGYQLIKPIREMCVFASHNFLTQPPFGRMDFISCRNVLIYMEPYLQKKALTTFHYALNPTGYLWLGKSETISSVPDLFTPASKTDKLFSRKNVPGRFMHTTTIRSEQTLRDMHAISKTENTRTDYQTVADEIMLRQYTPAGVVINDSMEIVHFRGATGKFLEQHTGKPSHNLIKMAKEGLGFELRNILRKVIKDNVPQIKENIPLIINGQQRSTTIEALPLNNTIELHYLILFHDHDVPAQFSQSEELNGNTKEFSEKARIDAKDKRIAELESELLQTRDDMRAITDDQEAVNEELQSVNEELMSGGEELQSLNEELESSKEELQSTNEELTVVNQEMISLNEQVTEAKNYAESIVTNLRTPLLVLDQHLRIRSANSAFYKTFQLNEAEIEGKLIFKFADGDWEIPALRRLLEQILPEQSKIKDFEVRHNFQSIGMRTMLLNAHENRIENSHDTTILLSIEDITERELHRNKEKELLAKFHMIVMHAPVSIAILSGKELVMDLVNDPFLYMLGKNINQVAGQPLFTILPEIKESTESKIQHILDTGETYSANEIELTIHRENKETKGYFNFVYQPILEIGGHYSEIICMAFDVTVLVKARKSIEIHSKLFNDLLMAAPAFVCTMTGPDHVYDLVNKRYQKLFGKRRIKGKPMLKALPELIGQGMDKILDKVYETGEHYVGIEIPMSLARDENLVPELRYFNFSYQPMYDMSQKIYAILGFGYEVTDQVVANLLNLETQEKRANLLESEVQQRTIDLIESNELLQQKYTELKSMNVELQSFNYISSHDLQEPLRKIQTFATHILSYENDALSEKGKDYFRRMQDAANRMQELIENLLSYSRLGKIESQFEMVDLNEVIVDVLSELTECVSEKDAIIDAKGLCRVKAIPFQMRQLFKNLITNAIKFSTSGIQPRIIITSNIAKGNVLDIPGLSLRKEYCHIRVSDNGIGFAPEYRERVFELFERLQPRDEFPGTGVGLAIVKKIVDNHNGFIFATSELGKGATFDIYFPAK